MKYIKLNNIEIPYQIAKKKNKNTYFYFKSEGYIQINLSKYQNEVDAVNYIKNNSHKFINKFTKTSNKQYINENQIMFKGKVYDIVITSNNIVDLDEDNNVAFIPTNDVNHPIIKLYYRDNMVALLHVLHNKYKHNPYVSLEGVTYNTRYTRSRHGSCNARKKNININLHLIKYNEVFTEYVYLHEISHLKHQNHGKEFYDLLEKLCPNYKEIRKELKNIYR